MEVLNNFVLWAFLIAGSERERETLSARFCCLEMMCQKACTLVKKNTNTCGYFSLVFLISNLQNSKLLAAKGPGRLKLLVLLFYPLAS